MKLYVGINNIKILLFYLKHKVKQNCGGRLGMTLFIVISLFLEDVTVKIQMMERAQ